MTDPLVTTDWLVANLEQVVVLDATYYLPPDPERSRADFATAHVPGARLFAIDEVADSHSDLPHMLPDETVFAAAMAELGIDGSRPVVVYDRSANHFSAPRVWFMLRLFGLQQSYVLDGGLPAWVEAGHATEAGDNAGPAVAAVAWTLDRSRVLSGTQMAQRVAAGDDVILDARARNRFDGQAPEPRPGLSSGHMPGAYCVPFVELTGADGRFASVAQLQDRFADFDRSEPIVTCGSGMTACVLALALERIGVRARLYDGSWAEWGQGQLGDILTA